MDLQLDGVDQGQNPTVMGVSDGINYNSRAGSGEVIVLGKFGAYTVGKDGSGHYQLDNSLPATQALGPGQTAHEVFSVTVANSNGKSATHDVSIDIRGTVDAPSVSASAEPGAVHSNIDLTGNPHIIDTLNGVTPDSLSHTYQKDDVVVIGQTKGGKLDLKTPLPDGFKAYDSAGHQLAYQDDQTGHHVGFKATCQQILDGVNLAIPPSITSSNIEFAIGHETPLHFGGLSFNAVLTLETHGKAAVFGHKVPHNLGAIQAGDELDIKIDIDKVDTGGSETLSTKITGVPHGVELHDDSGHSIHVNSPNQVINLNGWDLDHLHATVPTGLHHNAVVQIIATATGADGTQATTTKVVPMVLNPNSPGEFSMASPDHVTEGDVGKFTINFFGNLQAGEHASVLIKSHMDMSDIDMAKFQLPAGVTQVMDPVGSTTPKLIGGDFVYKVEFTGDGSGPHLQQIEVGVPITKDSIVEHGDMLTAQMLKDPDGDPKFLVTDQAVHRIALQDAGSSEVIIKPEPGQDPHIFGEVPTDAGGEHVNWQQVPPIIGKYGVLVFQANGQYTFVANSQSEAIKQLGEGQVGEQSFVVHGQTDTGKNVQHEIHLNVIGANDPPTISGVVDAQRTLGGTTSDKGVSMTVKDPDGDKVTVSLDNPNGHGTDKFGNAITYIENAYIRVEVTENGIWHMYTKVGAGVPPLVDDKGQPTDQLRLNLKLVADDGHGGRTELFIHPTINAKGGVSLQNHGGDITEVTDGSSLSTSGELIGYRGYGNDLHAGNVAEGSDKWKFSLDEKTDLSVLNSRFGQFIIDPQSGKWQYHGDPSKVTKLGEGETYGDTVTVTLTDDATNPPKVNHFKLTVQVHGVDDLPQIASTTVEPGGTYMRGVSGEMTATDPDTDTSALSWSVTEQQGLHGRMVMDSDGHWHYHADNTDPIWASNAPVVEQFVVTTLQSSGYGTHRILDLTLEHKGSALSATGALHDTPIQSYSIDASHLVLRDGADTFEAASKDGLLFLQSAFEDMGIKLPDGFKLVNGHEKGGVWIPDNYDSKALEHLEVIAPQNWAGDTHFDVVNVSGLHRERAIQTVEAHEIHQGPPPPPPTVVVNDEPDTTTTDDVTIGQHADAIDAPAVDSISFTLPDEPRLNLSAMPSLDNIQDHIKGAQSAPIPAGTIALAAQLLNDTHNHGNDANIIKTVENQEQKKHVANPDAVVTKHDNDDSASDNLHNNEQLHQDHIPNHLSQHDDNDPDDGTGLT